MKPVKMLPLTAAALILFLSVGQVFADNMDIKRRAVNTTAREALKETKSLVVIEAASGAQSVYNAVSLIRDGKSGEAKDILVKTSKDLDKAGEKGEEFLTMDVYVNIAEGVDTPEKAERLMRKANEAIARNDPQFARMLLVSLVSEIDISAVRIPLKSYKNCVNQAIASIDKGNITDAESYLLETAGLLVTETEVIPIPALTAKAFINEAKGMVNKDPEKALELVKSAQTQLKLNAILGYGASQAYINEADSVRKKVLSKRYEKVKEDISSALASMADSVKEDASQVGKDIKKEISSIMAALSS